MKNIRLLHSAESQWCTEKMIGFIASLVRIHERAIFYFFPTQTHLTSYLRRKKDTNKRNKKHLQMKKDVGISKKGKEQGRDERNGETVGVSSTSE